MNNYFSHDSNARNSDKLIPLRMRWGAEGYGIYFMILERLREEPEYTSVKDYNMIAFDLRVDTGKVKSVIEDFGLFVFTDDGKYFYSESFKRRMTQKDEKSKKLSEAGKKGNERRWKNNAGNQQENHQPIATQSPPDRKCDENLSQEKESKEYIPPISPIVDPNEYVELSKLKDHVINFEQAWYENIAMNRRLSPGSIIKWLETFFSEQEMNGETERSLKDIKKHFNNWLRNQLDNDRKEVKNATDDRVY